MTRLIKEIDAVEAVFSRADSIAEVVEDRIRSATDSIHAAHRSRRGIWLVTRSEP